MMIMLKHNQHHHITSSLCSSGCSPFSYNIQSKDLNVKVKSPTKANTDHHNGDFKIVLFLLQ